MSEIHTELIRKSVKLIYDIQLIKYNFARLMTEKIKKMYKSKPTIIEVSGYQTYFWNNGPKELRLRPYSLTSKSGSLLDSKEYAPKEPIITVDWNKVFDSLNPNFRLRLSVFESIKSFFDMLVGTKIETGEVDITNYDGRAQFGDFPAYYKISDEGIYIVYYEPITSGVVSELIAKSEESGCDAKKHIYEMLKKIAEGINLSCVSGKVSYSVSVCTDLDQFVTFLRQLWEKKVFCITYKAKRIMFVDGPLEGLMWTSATQYDYVFYENRKSLLIDIDQLRTQIESAIQNCKVAMEKTYCSK